MGITKDWLLHSFKRAPAIKTAVLLLFTVGLFLAAGSLNYYVTGTERVNGFVAIYTDNHHLKLSTTDINISNVTSSDAMRIQAVNRALAESAEFDSFNCLTNHTFLVLDFAGSDSLVRGYTDGRPQKGIRFYKNNSGVTNASDINSLQVSPSFFSALGIKITDGKDFSDCNATFKKDTVFPAVLGSHFKDYYKIGDRFEANPFLQTSGFTVTFEVVGFASEGDAIIPFNGDPDDGEKLLYLDSMIITPLFHFEDAAFSDPELTEQASVYSAVSFSGNIVTTNLTKSDIAKKLTALYESYGFEDLHISEVMRVSPIFRADIDKYFSVMLACSLTILISAVVCLSVNLINQLLAQLKTFAVHLISGGTLADIRRLMTAEVITLIVVSNALAIAGLSLFGGVFSYSQSQIFSVQFGGLGAIPLLGMLAIDLAVLFCSTAIPIFRLHHVEFDSLLRGRE